MDDLKQQMRDYFIQYASYVILDRAIPHGVDGLKPVQRRILETLWKQHDDKFHKVANIAGQTMQLHPHGDAPIYEALVTLANKGYLLETQGNFGNLHTGDPAAAGRYIETKLSLLARETLFNPEITEKIPSYDGRNEEPVVLPAKIPLLLMQGAEGIAVGMSTRIFPHNFQELLEAEILHLEGKPFRIYPDFPTGGVMDKSLYDKGKGKVKLRAKIEVKDAKTLVIREICYGTTTESLIRSIDDAAKKGKIKIDSINDYTSKQVEIEINLPRGQYAEEILDALYAFTECEVQLNSQVILIKDKLPWETDVHEVLKFNAENLMVFLKRELEIEKDRLLEKIFFKTLERIFIENRLYKKIESIKTLEKIHEVLLDALKAYRKQFFRDPLLADLEKLLQIPIRRISQFDIDRNQEEISSLEMQLKEVEQKLKNVKKYTIDYLKGLIQKFGKEYPRKTKIKSIEELDKKAISTKEIRVGFDLKTGFIGTKIAGPIQIHCTNFDKLLVFQKEGSYQVVAVTDKRYFENACFCGIADKTTVFNVIYKEKKTQKSWVKRFIVDKFILDKIYRFIPEETELQYFSSSPNDIVELVFSAKSKKKLKLEEVEIKGVQTRGSLISSNKISKITSLLK